MFKSNLKKFNSILILALLYVSLKNITKFTDDSLEMPVEQLRINSNNELSSSFDPLVSDVSPGDIELEINQSLKKRFELVKKDFEKGGVRYAPGCIVRDGTYIGPQTVVMNLAFVNIPAGLDP